MTWELDIENVAGIRSGSATLEPGVNAVRGTNWQGKTSFVRALETAMGTERVLTEGEDEGRVALSTDDETVSVRLEREDGTVVRHGDPYLQSEKSRVAASLYAFLDDDNPVREAVRNDDNLETVLTRPLDFENIDERIAELTREREQVERELEDAEEAAGKLPDAQETVERLESELAELTEQRAAMQEGLEDERSVSDRREELSELKAERDAVEQRIGRLERSVERTREKLSDRKTELAELDIPEADEDIAATIEDVEAERDRLERDAELLQSVYAPTKRILDEDRLELITDLDRAVDADDLVCWTCGSESTRADIEANLETLGDRIGDRRSRVRELEAEIADLRQRRREVEQATRRESELEAEIDDLAATLEDRETSLERARERRESLRERIEDLSETVERDDDELTDVKSRIKYTERQLEEARDELERLESRADDRDRLEAEREDLTAEIHRLRERKSELRRRTREAFDAAIRDVVLRFDVGFEMVRLTSEFDLVVARDGREASLSALSEGELELLGIVAALAGYEAFDVTEDVQLMLLDGLGGLADDNLRTLVDYLDERATFLVFTTHPENSTFEEHTIDPRDWSVVSPDGNVAAD